jgi:recombinase/resolvase-like protein/recombinase-like zinc beta ribbon protein
MEIFDYIIRVSRMGDRAESADSTLTIDDQRQRCREVITARGGRTGREHKATDVSGKGAVDSPPYRAALERVRAGESDGIAFAYGDRMSRNWWNLGRFFGELDAAGGDLLIAGKDGMDYRSQQGRAMLGMEAVMSEQQWWDAWVRGERTADKVIFERGVANVVPYGYRRNGTFLDRVCIEKVRPDLDAKALVPDPVTSPVVVRIFDERIAGTSWSDIAVALDRDGIAPPKGKHWKVSTLRYMVGNEAYIGVVRYRDRRNESAHEPLVTRAVFQAAQAAKSVQRTGTYAAGVAGGLVRCSSCGGNMVVGGSAKHLGYQCRRQDNGERCPKPVFITKRAVDDLVDTAVRDALTGSVGSSPHHELSHLVENERAAADELNAYVEVAAALDRVIFERGLRVRQERLEAARDAREAEEAKAGLLEELPEADAYAGSPLDDRRRVAAALIEKVVIMPPVSGGKPAERVSIHWR